MRAGKEETCMANPEQYALLQQQGPEHWNAWRLAHPNEEVDLSGADLSQRNLSGAMLNGANLSLTMLKFANLSGANLSRANLRACFGKHCRC